MNTAQQVLLIAASEIGYKEKAQIAALALAGKESTMVTDYAKPNSEELDLSNPFALLKFDEYEEPT
jgi:hypothetical protein